MRARCLPGTARSSRGCWRGADGEPTTEARDRRSRSDTPGRRRAGRPTGGVGPRGPGGRLRLGAPDAGDDAQDPQPAAVVRGRVRHLRRRVDPRRAAPARRRARASRATPRCWPSATRRALDELPDDLVRGPIRKRLVDGAKRRYKSGLRRSLIAMRSERYFRLLDALDGLVAAEPPPTAAGEEPVTGHHRLGLQARAQGREERGRMPPTRTATRHCTESARAPSGFATPRPRPVTTRCPIGPRPSRACSATIRTAWSAART